MANTLTALIPKIISGFDQFFVKEVVMSRNVNSDFSMNATERGSTITVPISSRRTVSNVTPSETSPAAEATTITNVDIALNSWKKVSFNLTNKEKHEVRNNPDDYVPQSVRDCLVSLAEYVNEDLYGVYKSANLHVGTPGTTPFASDTSVIKAVRKLANQNYWPKRDRKFMLDADADGNIVDLADFKDADKAGTDMTKVNGELGHKFGFDFFYCPEASSHVAGTMPTGSTVDNATAGAASLALTIPAGSAVSVKEGDIVEIVGHATDYVVTADASGTGTGSAADLTIAISPALSANITGTPVITIVGDSTTYAVNLAFHRSAIGFAVRPQAIPEGAPAGAFTPVVDPLAQLAMTLHYDIQYQQASYYLSILYGWKMIKQSGIIRVHG